MFIHWLAVMVAHPLFASQPLCSGAVNSQVAGWISWLFYAALYIRFVHVLILSQNTHLLCFSSSFLLLDTFSSPIKFVYAGGFGQSGESSCLENIETCLLLLLHSAFMAITTHWPLCLAKKLTLYLTSEYFFFFRAQWALKQRNKWK